jgi:hypothetical protein
MGIDLTQGSNVFVLIVCGFLLLGWLVISRRLTGLLCCAVVALMVFASVHSDGQQQTLLGILISGGIGLCLLLVLSALLRVRRRRFLVSAPVNKRSARKSRR